MNKEVYTLENLQKTFLNNHEEAYIHHLEVKETYRREYGKEYPHPYFSLSLALHEICKEINQINKALDILGDFPID